MSHGTKKIEKKYLILCEGRDAWEFIVSFLNSDALRENEVLREEVQVIDFGGNEELPKKLSVYMKTPGFENVKRILIVRDAEKDFDAAVSAIKSALNKNELPCPNSVNEIEVSKYGLGVAYTLFPMCSRQHKKGTLEDLCVKILDDDKLDIKKQKINSFMDDLKIKRITELRHRFKTELHIFLSISDKYVSMKVGEAARAGAFDWFASELDELKSIMEEMFAE